MEQLQFELKGSKTLGIEQAAALLHMNPDHLRRMCRNGEIPAAKVGKKWFFIEEDLLNWVRELYSQGAVQSPVSQNFRRQQCLEDEKTVTTSQIFESVESAYDALLGLRTKQ